LRRKPGMRTRMDEEEDRRRREEGGRNVGKKTRYLLNAELLIGFDGSAVLVTGIDDTAHTHLMQILHLPVEGKAAEDR